LLRFLRLDGRLAGALVAWSAGMRLPFWWQGKAISASVGVLALVSLFIRRIRDDIEG
jgi:hypothetical protein